jgi:hypothetical protein
VQNEWYSFLVLFPPYSELARIPFGECVVRGEDLILVPRWPLSHAHKDTNSSLDYYRFQVKLYPRGGGHNPATRSLLDRFKKEKVGVYLQFLPDHDNDIVDATFKLRLIGKQERRPFDVEWCAGMRFAARTQLGEGRANDFGTHIMEADRLPEFLGIPSNSFNSDGSSDNTANLVANTEVDLLVQILIHSFSEKERVSLSGQWLCTMG